ncbi:MAG: conjugative transposon protein TraN [Chitinophagaceae bacterium]|nr:conjugative transposon protein TraN [Chitinophagaceae bacterium]
MMKKKSAAWISGIMMFLIALSGYAQETRTTQIKSDELSISSIKTTNLIFPYAIKSVDKGSRDILVQKAIGVENVLQVKAARALFPETNLTVVTADGSLYSYVLNYAEKPLQLNIRMDQTGDKPSPMAVFNSNETNDLLQARAQKVWNKRNTIERKGDHSNGIRISIKGIYVNGDELYFQLGLENTSVIDYDIKMLRFFIMDKKKSKRTTSQELVIDPVYILGDTRLLRTNTEHTMVVAVPKFTIPDKKNFIIQMQENNGGRNLRINIENKDLLKAHIVN